MLLSYAIVRYFTPSMPDAYTAFFLHAMLMLPCRCWRCCCFDAIIAAMFYALSSHAMRYAISPH